MSFNDRESAIHCVGRVKRLPDVVTALKNEKMRLIGKKPAVAIKQKSVFAKPATPYLWDEQKKLPSYVDVRYLLQPGELEGSTQRATDPVWSFDTYTIGRAVSKPDAPVVYYLHNGPKRGFVSEELMVVPPGTVKFFCLRYDF